MFQNMVHKCTINLDLRAKLGKIFFPSKLFATFLHFGITFSNSAVRRQPGADRPEYDPSVGPGRKVAASWRGAAKPRRRAGRGVNPRVCACVRVRIAPARKEDFIIIIISIKVCCDLCRFLCRYLCRCLCRRLAGIPLRIGGALCRWLCRWLCR